MSEQTIQNELYSVPVKLDKYTCLSLGATTIQDLVKNKKISGLTVKECRNIKANKPDVLVLNKNKEIKMFKTTTPTLTDSNVFLILSGISFQSFFIPCPNPW